MRELTVHQSGAGCAADPAKEAERLRSLLAERRQELCDLQMRLREFKERYARTVGSKLAELAELERDIHIAERRAFGLEDETAEAVPDDRSVESVAPPPVRKALRKLFWKVARAFHPDLAANEHEAGRRHSIMAEASRAYRDGDAESLNMLLEDEDLHLICATAAAKGASAEGKKLLFDLEDELRTVEYGIKRLRMDSLYRLMLSVEEDERLGRDPLATMARNVELQIKKARNRLEHLA